MRSKSPRAVWGLGAGRVKWCSGVGEGASFEKACSRLRQSMFFTSHVCQRFFQGAAAAAAGRGSPPPPGAACERRWVDIDLREHCYLHSRRPDLGGLGSPPRGGWVPHGTPARFRRLCARSPSGLGEVTTLPAFSLTVWRKRGPRGNYRRELVRLWSART